MQLPKPSCPQGYTDKDLREILKGSLLDRFNKWMTGQTMSVCDGQGQRSELASYRSTPCYNNPHGAVVYAWDLERFLEGKPVID
jgi:hypothetical protein